MRRLLIVFGFFVLLGCDSKLVTVVLAPSQVATAVNRDYDFDKDTGVSCAAQREDFSCYGHYGVLPDAEGIQPIAIGLLHDYAHAEFELLGLVETGSCSERINCIYRGLLMFDLTKFGPPIQVVTAKLKYEGTIDKHSDATKWTEEENCIAKIGTVLSPWGGFDLPAEFFGASSSAGFSTGVDVSQIVRSWATGSSPNHGFILVGPKEGTGKNDDDRCVATLSNIRLEVQLNVAKSTGY